MNWCMYVLFLYSCLTTFFIKLLDLIAEMVVRSLRLLIFDYFNFPLGLEMAWEFMFSMMTISSLPNSMVGRALDTVFTSGHSLVF